MTRSISINGDLYAELKQHCDDRTISVTSLIESLLVDITGESGVLKRAPGRRGERRDRQTFNVHLPVELVAKIERHLLAAYPKHKRPSKRRWLDELLGRGLHS